MARPILLAVDDDVSVLEAVVQDLRRQYGEHLPRHARRQRPGRARHPGPAQDARRAGRSDHQRPAHAGNDRRGDAGARPRHLSRRAPRAAHRLRRHRGRHPRHQFRPHPLLPQQALGSAGRKALPRRSTICSKTGRQAIRPPFEGLRVIGHRWSLNDHSVRNFLSRNHVPYRWLDVCRRR